MKCTIEHIKNLTVYGIEHVGPYMMIGQSFMTLWDWVSKHRKHPTIPSFPHLKNAR